MKILILGVNGFIGNELTSTILEKTDWHVYGLDLFQNRIERHIGNSHFKFKCADINEEKEWIQAQIARVDVVIPLAAIATPMSYIKDPLGVFHSVFETNLWIIKECARLKRRLIFPSTSEVYGMCTDDLFQEMHSSLVLGPINKSRWIYSNSKQLLDRIIWAYGKEGLPFTIFRPFNWIGHSQDDINNSQNGSARVVPEFLGNIIHQKPVVLVAGGEQRRSFTDIRDGIDALMKIIRNNQCRAEGKIFNIGNPENNISIKEIAQILVDTLKTHEQFYELANRAKFTELSYEEYYGPEYQDVQQRKPDIRAIQTALGWSPTISLRSSIKDIVEHHVANIIQTETKEFRSVPDNQLRYGFIG